MHRDLPLHGKVAIVTGATRGIGFAIAARLLEQGADVVATGRTDEHVARAREQLAAAGGAKKNRGGRLHVASVDVRDYTSVEQVVNETVQQFGGLDILVNNAGVGNFGEVAAQPVAEWHETIETNLTGVFNCCHAAIPHLRRRGGGWIVNISSLASKNPFAGAAAYCASKAGLNAFSEALMQEVRYDNIRVSYVLPGSVGTEFGGSHAGAGAEWKLAPEDVARVVVDLLQHDPRSLPSRVEIRPSKPRK
jgi:NAD(P)-dependent dehydrogenase (short-subunit alcohol dehydrogenase family)